MSLLKHVAQEVSEKASKQLSVRLKPAQLDLLKTEAKAAGTSVNELVGRLISFSSTLPEFAPQAAEAFSSFLVSPNVRAQISAWLEEMLKAETGHRLGLHVREEWLEVRGVSFWPASSEFSIQWRMPERRVQWTLSQVPARVAGTLSAHGDVLFAPNAEVRLHGVHALTDLSTTKLERREDEPADPGFYDDDLPF